MRSNARRKAREAEFLRIMTAVQRGEMSLADAEREFRRLGLAHDKAQLASMPLRCRECGAEGHKRSECPQMSCHVCGEHGHLKRRCPTLAEN